MTTKAELLSMIAEVPMDRKIVFQMGHLAEVGDLLEPTGVDMTATIDSTVITIADPHWTDSAYNTETHEICGQPLDREGEIRCINLLPCDDRHRDGKGRVWTDNEVGRW